MRGSTLRLQFLSLLVACTRCVGGFSNGDVSDRGHCTSRPLPAGCRSGSLGEVGWERFLTLVCDQHVKRVEVAQAALDALGKFTRENAEGCLSGLVVTLFVIMGTGADEWSDQIVRFLPDGQARFLMGIWEVLHHEGKARYNQFAATVPAGFQIEPPFPNWPFPGLMSAMKDAQDLAWLPELPPTARCNEAALEGLAECGGRLWAGVLRALCDRCTIANTNGLPCMYDEAFMSLLAPLFEAHRDRMQLLSCPHGFLALILSLGARTSQSPPEVSPEVWHVVGSASTGRSVEIVHAVFRQMAGDLLNRFAFNIPMIDLAPFPFHTGALRSARLNAEWNIQYYNVVLAAVCRLLKQLGVPHVLLPGDMSMASNRVHDVYSLFIPYDMKKLLRSRDTRTSLTRGLAEELAGLWRLVRVNGGLWQLGEEPYRFSPHAGVAYRMFCRECIYVSLYFYLQDEHGSLVPLAPWTPCVILRRAVFPAKLKKLVDTQEDAELASAEEEVPIACDRLWLARAQRKPQLPRDFIPEDFVSPEVVGGPGKMASCRAARTSVLKAVGAADFPDDPLSIIDHPMPLPTLDLGFDLSDGVFPGMGLFDLMRQREDSEREGLRRYSDKVRFKTRCHNELEVPIPKILFMSSRRHPELVQVLQGLGTSRFVAKPTHLAATSYVYVMRDGINLISGQPTSVEAIAAGLNEAWGERHVDDWATEFTPPGIIIEELIEPSTTSTRPAETTPDELKCHTFFGEMFLCEWVYVKNMTSGSDGADHFWGAHMQGDRAKPTSSHKSLGIPNFVSRGLVFKDKSCMDCEEPLPLSDKAWARLIEVVEKVAAGTDHIRIDVFITPEGSIVVNEGNISFLKISKLPPDIIEEMRKRWLEGYRSLHS
eukprot:TRINITY_DN51470_c0_g1_i1.p1 TRINITY_DN51470_c0_g1~~TRINITY_DN51470_c0_g1_i1.p1  ORF type:complete len:879 (-),score=92.07 TRINITY_DN51470_c0_g1_i1:152-2788(-)